MDVMLAISPGATLAARAATQALASAQPGAPAPAVSRPAPAAAASSLPATKPISDSMMSVLLAAQSDAKDGRATANRNDGHGHHAYGHGKPPVATPPPVDPPPVVTPPPSEPAPAPAPAPTVAPTAEHIATPRIVEIVRQQLAERTAPSRRQPSDREQAQLAAARAQHRSTVQLAGMRAALRWQTAAALLAASQAQFLALQHQPYRTGLFI